MLPTEPAAPRLRPGQPRWPPGAALVVPAAAAVQAALALARRHGHLSAGRWRSCLLWQPGLRAEAATLWNWKAAALHRSRQAQQPSCQGRSQGQRPPARLLQWTPPPKLATMPLPPGALALLQVQRAEAQAAKARGVPGLYVAVCSL